MTSILLDASIITDSKLQYCRLCGLTGGTITDCALHFCELSEFETKLDDCKLAYVSLNEEVQNEN